MRPDDSLVRHYLTYSRVMRLATVSIKGAPSLTPIWFVVVQGKLISTTAATTVAARNIAAVPLATVLLDAEKAGPSDYLLRLGGRADLHYGLPPVNVLARFALRYYLAASGLGSELAHLTRWRLRNRYYAQSQPVWLEIEPETSELVPVPSVRAWRR